MTFLKKCSQLFDKQVIYNPCILLYAYQLTFDLC